MANSAIGSQALTMLSLPSGMLVDYAGTVEPSGWLMCDGRAVSRTVYASLFSSIGTSYGAGDGSTTFNLPDFRGRFARYNDNMNTSAGAAGRDSGRAHGSSQSQATAKNGLSFSNVSHSSSGSTTTTGGHSHTLNIYVWNTSGGNGPESAGGYDNSVAHSTTSDGAHNHNVSVSGTIAGSTLNSALSSDAETRPINLSCNKLIKI